MTRTSKNLVTIVVMSLFSRSSILVSIMMITTRSSLLSSILSFKSGRAVVSSVQVSAFTASGTTTKKQYNNKAATLTSRSSNSNINPFTSFDINSQSLRQIQLHQQQQVEQTTRLFSTTASEASETVVSSSSNNDESSSNDDLQLEIELPTNDNDIELLKIRHSTAHVMAMAVQRLYKDAQVTIGPWIDNGFYYDFYFQPTTITNHNQTESTSTTTSTSTSETETAIATSRKLTDQDLKLIKKEMDKIISSNLPITREEVTYEVAKARIESIGETFKLEILNSIVERAIKPAEEIITIYNIGTEWWDLCAGPHVESTGKLPKKAIELQTVAGAYWRGDENREQLQRIYGTAWYTPQQLKLYKQRLVEAKKRDHRILGKQYNLFSIQQDDAGCGLVFWHPAGAKVRRQIENFWINEHVSNGYDIVNTPHVANLDLWKTSGHFDFYKNDMFEPINVDNEQYQLKPMNCPFHCLLYKNELRSYRDLPYRWAELGTVYRYERSGTLHGLFRVRGFTQDDAHIFCLPEQLQEEIINVLDLTETILSRFGFTKYDIMLSTRPEKSVGTDTIWDAATNALIGALNKKGWKYNIDEGGGAFYGPKIDVKIRDAIGRLWQCSTIQCDFNLPERFELEYVSEENKRERPIMVHRAIFGSIERFFGILIENCAGEFPLWLAPTQLRLLPVTDSAQEYCTKIVQQGKKLGLRIEVDRGNERLAKQIRNAEQQRIPLIGVVGMKEVDNNTIAIRCRKLGGDIGSFSVTDLLNEIQQCSIDATEMTKYGIIQPKEEVVEVEVESATTAVIDTVATSATTTPANE